MFVKKKKKQVNSKKDTNKRFIWFAGGLQERRYEQKKNIIKRMSAQ